MTREEELRLIDEAVAAGKCTRYPPGAYVIEYCGGRLKDIERGFSLAVKRAGLPGRVTPHVLKHTAISWLAETWPIDKIADYTDTHPDTVRRIYRKVNGERLREMGEDLADGLFEAGRTKRNTPGGRRNVR